MRAILKKTFLHLITTQNTDLSIELEPYRTEIYVFGTIYVPIHHIPTLTDSTLQSRDVTSNLVKIFSVHIIEERTL